MLFSPEVYHDIIARDESAIACRKAQRISPLPRKTSSGLSALTFPKMTTPLPGPLTLGKPSSLTDSAKFADAGKVTTMSRPALTIGGWFCGGGDSLSTMVRTAVLGLPKVVPPVALLRARLTVSFP
jgi:hypothetical protein